MIYPFDVTAFIEGGWWIVEANDIGKRSKVGTLSEVIAAGQLLYANHLGLSVSQVAVDVRVYRKVGGGLVRARLGGARNPQMSGAAVKPSIDSTLRGLE